MSTNTPDLNQIFASRKNLPSGAYYVYSIRDNKYLGIQRYVNAPKRRSHIIAKTMSELNNKIKKYKLKQLLLKEPT